LLVKQEKFYWEKIPEKVTGDTYALPLLEASIAIAAYPLLQHVFMDGPDVERRVDFVCCSDLPVYAVRIDED
jgi:hypothetical protein